MRICLITSSYTRFEDDGNARFVRSIAEAQAALGHEVHVVAPYAPEVRPYSSPVHMHWFRYIWPARWGHMGHAQSLENDRQLRLSAYWQAPSYFAAQLLAVMRVVQRHHIDVIHAHWIVPNGVSGALISNWTHRRLFISLHGSDVYLATRQAWLGRIAGWAFRQASGITACSPDLVEGAVRVGADRQRIKLMPWGASPEVFAVQSDDGKLRKHLGIPDDALVILGLGRLVAKKGFAQLLQAAPRVLAAYPNIWFVIAGDGPERARLETLASELGISERVIFPGAVYWTEVADYLRMCSIFIVPSIRDASGNLDGLPTTVLEAMAAGRPVIATSIGGIPLVVENDVNGLIVPEADPAALAEAISRLASQSKQRIAMGLEARCQVEQNLNWSAVARRFDNLYNVR